MARPKGVPNKIGGQVKKNTVAVFDRLGGIERMVKWAEDNLTEFYRLYAKLLPSEVTLSHGEDSIEDYVNSLDDAEFNQFAEGIKRLAISAGRGEEVTAAGTSIQPDKVH